MTVHYATADDTGAAPDDYEEASGTLSFVPGETTKAVIVLVNGDTLHETDETFLVNLSSATNATIQDGQGVATIANDDVHGRLKPQQHVAHRSNRRQHEHQQLE